MRLCTRALLIIYGSLVVLVGSRALAASSGVNSDEAVLSALITKHAKAALIERAILSCVLKVESNYRMGVISDTDDYGIAQINAKTARMYKLDLVELLTNADYSVAAAANILKDYKRAFKPTETNTWVARYNIGYQSLTTTNVGGYYVAYNSKVYKCVLSGDYL